MTSIVILAADGKQSSKTVDYPAFLVEIGDSTVLEIVASKAEKLENPKIFFVTGAAESEKWHLAKIASNLSVFAKNYPIESPTAGATCSALLAATELPPDEDLLILNGNEFVDVDYSEIVAKFKHELADAGLIYFDSTHPRYSYARIDANGIVQETVEKQPISRNATAGFYWFSRVSTFLEAARQQLLKQSSLDGKYFICPTFNEVILMNKKVVALQIEKSKYMPLKSKTEIASRKIIRAEK